MKIVRDALRAERKQLLIKGDIFLEGAIRLEVIEVAHVMAQDCPGVRFRARMSP